MVVAPNAAANRKAIQKFAARSWGAHRLGNCWIAAQYLGYVATPGPRLRAAIDAAYAAHGLDASPYMAMHVRHGDKKFESTPHALADYGECCGSVAWPASCVVHRASCIMRDVVALPRAAPHCRSSTAPDPAR